MAQLIFYQIHLAAILRIDCRVAKAAARRPVSWLLHFLGEITHQVPARSEWYLGSNEVERGWGGRRGGRVSRCWKFSYLISLGNIPEIHNTDIYKEIHRDLDKCRYNER